VVQKKIKDLGVINRVNPRKVGQMRKRKAEGGRRDEMQTWADGKKRKSAPTATLGVIRDPVQPK